MMNKSKLKMSMVLLVVGLVIGFFPTVAMAATNASKPKRKLMAGAYALPITPNTDEFGIPINPDGSTVFLAGFGGPASRPASAVHDDVWVRSLILEYDGTMIIFVALDLIGYSIDQVYEVKEEVEDDYGIMADNIIIATTHTHSGPDTLGLWTGTIPGVNWPYMEYIRGEIVESIVQAYQNMEKARLRFGSTSVPGLMKNSRNPGRVYPDLEVMKVEDRRGDTIATMINYAGHPEVLVSNNLEITSDYVGYLRDKVEEELGGVAIFFNGALGGMVTPDVDERTFEKAQEIGYTLADATIGSLENAKKSPPKIPFNSEKRTFDVPLENVQFYFGILLGVLHRSSPWYEPGPGFGSIKTEVNVINIGEAQMITMPGEVLPSIGHRLKEAMKGEYNFQIGLGNDELGYIIPQNEWDPVEYEESMSIGMQTGILMEEILMEMLDGT